MKRLVTNKNGEEIYGRKWQNIESSSDDDDLHSAAIETTRTAQVSDIEAASTITSNANHQIPKGKTRVGPDAECMYRAALRSEWAAAAVVLKRDPNLASDYVTEMGDRALHVAAAMKHKEFVQKLVERMSKNELELLDGRGNTACCYAAMSGAVEIARLMIAKNPSLVTARDQNNVTPLHKAALRGNKKMVSYLLKSTNIDDLSKDEWFDLLLVTIRRNMFDVAIEIVEKNGSLATMASDEGTALHLLARQDTSNIVIRSTFLSIFWDTFFVSSFWKVKSSNFYKLAEKLWGEMQRLEKDSPVELIRVRQHILHDAAREGHAKLITMVCRSYPQLIWDIDGNGYTIFHIAVMHRQNVVFHLIHQVGSMIDLSTTSQDKDGNNILHLAAKLPPPTNRLKLPLSPMFLMQRELGWFKATEAFVPPSCLEMRNKDGLTPRELFSKEHKILLEYSRTWMRNTADSFILIATIWLTVVFTAAFAVPGGYDDHTGAPVLLRSQWFKRFLDYEVVALVSSVTSVVMFCAIMASNFEEDDFMYKLPFQLFIGFEALSCALAGAILAFMTAISLANPQKQSMMMGLGNGILYVVFPYAILVQISVMCIYWDNPLTRMKLLRLTRRALFR